LYKFIFVVLYVLCVLPIQAGQSSVVAPELKIISISLPPLQYYNDNNQLEGYFVEVIKAALATTELSYEMHLYPWARSYYLAQHKENVCIFSLNRIPEREHLFRWITPLAQTHSAMYSLKSSNISIRTIEEAKAYAVAAIRDGVYHQILERNGFEEGKNMYVVSDSDSLVKMFLSKPEIELIFSDDIILRKLAGKLGIDNNLFQKQFQLKHPPLEDYIACSPQTSKNITTKLVNGFKAIKESGRINEINAKWRPQLGDSIID
jgi:polar amino acid transport system substrate-binding protein